MAARARAARRLPVVDAVVPALSVPRRFERYVALGDSSTEGLMDPDGRGGFRGWSRRLAERIAAAQGGLLYANLAARGLTTREIRERQLAPALALDPDLATLFSGTNDVMRPRFDLREFAIEVRDVQRALRAAGATVLTFTLPDLSPLLPWARPLAPRIRAMNFAVLEAAVETGTRVVDFAAHAVATDARLWHADRIHANAAGHERIAAALAHALGLPGSDGSWSDPLPERPREHALRSAGRELAWAARYLLPWGLARLWPARPAALESGERARLVAVGR